MAELTPTSWRDRLASPVLLAVLMAFAAMSLMTLQLLKLQAAGVDFAGLWAGGKAAITDIGRLYDFRYVSALQNWPLGPGRLRPYVYPPSALPLFIPFALVPWNLGYGVWTGITGAFYGWAGWRAGAPRWFVLIPWVAFAAFCGQVTFLLGGLVMTALMMQDEDRPILAGVLFGLAAAVKPQLLILLPLGLIAQGRWKTIFATGITGLAMCAFATAVWGVQPWIEWFGALSRFQYLVSHARGLVDNAITPYAALIHFHQNGDWAFLLAPAALTWVWVTFRREADIMDRMVALFAGAFLISPYAMNYELALFAPATGVYLARKHDWRWPGYVAAAILQAMVIHPAFVSLAGALLLPIQKAIPRLPFMRRDEQASLIPNS